MRAFIPNIINLGLAFLFIDLRQRGEISTPVMIGLIALSFVVVNALYFYLKKYFVSKRVRELKKLGYLLDENPEEYLKKVDENLSGAKEYELDYLTLHKANVLHKINRDAEAIETLSSHMPLFLDENNKAIYFNNLVGLYLKQNDFKNAKKIFESNRDLLEKLEINPSFGFSILVNKASILLNHGDKKSAEKAIDEARKIAPSEKSQREIDEMKRKFLEK